MRNTRNVRIFSYDRGTGKYVFEDHRASVSSEEGILAEDKGVHRRCEASIRIMTTRDINAKPGDYVSLKQEEEPDKDIDMMITRVRDNRRGGLPHWRLIVNRRSRI